MIARGLIDHYMDKVHPIGDELVACVCCGKVMDMATGVVGVGRVASDEFNLNNGVISRGQDDGADILRWGELNRQIVSYLSSIYRAPYHTEIV